MLCCLEFVLSFDKCGIIRLRTLPHLNREMGNLSLVLEETIGTWVAANRPPLFLIGLQTIS